MDYNIRTRKRGKGYQYTVSYKVAGEWKTKSKQGYKLAKDAKAAGQAVALDLAEFVPSVSIIPTFKETALLMHLDGLKSASTLKSYNSYLKQFAPIQDKKLDEVRYQDITEILQAYRVDHKFNSVKALVRYGGSVFRFGQKKLRAVRENPFEYYNLVPPKQSDVREVKVLSKDEIITLANSAPSADIAAVIAIQGLCGLRVSEALGLHRADILDNQITVSHQLKHGDLWAELKSKNGYRVVPLAPGVLPFLKVLPLRFDGRLYDLDYYAVQEFLAAQGLVSHHLRHSYATNLIGMGIDFKTASEFLGDKLETVMSTYAHVSVDMRKSAEDKIMENF